MGFRHLGGYVYLVINNPGNIQELLRIIRWVPNGNVCADRPVL